MKHSFKIQLSLVISLALLSACNESEGFKATAKTKVLDKAAEANAEPAAPVAAPSPEKAEAPAVPSSTVQIDIKPDEEKIIAGICRQKLAYDPSEILCALQEETSDTVWKNGGQWNTSWIKNKKAYWISPLAPAKRGALVYCPFVPGSDKAIYVSHFKLDADQEITLEAEIDDIGQVSLWKNADSKKEVFISPRNYKTTGTVKLDKGFYTVVIDATDTGALASGMIASFFDATGKVIRQTQSSTDWCIYRVTATTDVADFLNSTSACKSCMIGEEAAAAQAAK